MGADPCTQIPVPKWLMYPVSVQDPIPRPKTGDLFHKSDIIDFFIPKIYILQKLDWSGINENFTPDNFL